MYFEMSPICTVQSIFFICILMCFDLMHLVFAVNRYPPPSHSTPTYQNYKRNNQYESSQSLPIHRDYDEPALPALDYDHNQDVPRRPISNENLANRNRNTVDDHSAIVSGTSNSDDHIDPALTDPDSFQSQRHRSTTLDRHTEALRNDYSRPLTKYRLPIAPPAPYPYAPVPIPMPSYSPPAPSSSQLASSSYASSYENRGYGPSSGYHQHYPLNMYSAHAYPAIDFTSSYSPSSYHHHQHNQHQQLIQQQQLQSAISSLIARNSFLGFIDPIILLAIIAVPVIAMLGFGSLIMPFIPVIIYVLNIFFPVAGSGRKRTRRHLPITTLSSLLPVTMDSLDIDQLQRSKTDRLYQQLRNATTKFAS